jgi:hypothetical protein
MLGKFIAGDFRPFFFLSAQNPLPISEISITSGFYLMVSFTSEDKYAKFPALNENI